MDEMYQTPAPAEDLNLLDEFDTQLVQASSGKRFMNLLIDSVLLYLIWKLFLGKYVGMAMYYLGLYGEGGTPFLIRAYIVIYIIDIFYLAIFEAATGGRTPGKMITKSRAVNEDGSPITFKTAFLRSLSRAVPFESFSGLGSPCYPWHDKWTRTYVIDEAQSRLAE